MRQLERIVCWGQDAGYKTASYAAWNINASYSDPQEDTEDRLYGNILQSEEI